MLKFFSEKAQFLLCVSICAILFSSCAESSGTKLPVLEDYDKKSVQEERISLKWGVVTGPYGDMFMEIVEPLFAEKGYTVELVTYDNYTEPNFALANGEIDLNIFQHYQYLNSFKFEYDLNLSAISEVPTAPIGIYSDKYNSIGDLKDGDIIAIPDDSTNLSRALMVLSSSGVISVDPSVDTSKLTLKHIIKNPKKVKLVPLEAHLLCNELKNYDMAVINGNFALNGGLSLSDALYLESLVNHDYINVIAVRTDDVGRQFVMDLIGVLRSDEYKNAIMEDGGKYSQFQYPCNFSSLSD